jgi:hypothetical protein
MAVGEGHWSKILRLGPTVDANDKAVLATAHRLMKGISTTAFEIVPPTPPLVRSPLNHTIRAPP